VTRSEHDDDIDVLYRAAWGLCGDPGEAEDLVHETYARALARPRFVRKQARRGDLVRTLRDRFEARKRSGARQGAGAAQGGRPEADEVYAAIAALPEDPRVAIVAVDVAGLSSEEAARSLAVSPDELRRHLFIARETLAGSRAW
jgi:RNA polymerase sigma-70 factor (ECF subfamily)